MRKLPALFLLAALSLAFAPAPLPRLAKPKTDLQKMQGDWEMVTETIAGRKTCPGCCTPWRITGTRRSTSTSP